MKTHFLGKEHFHIRWNNGLKPAIEVESGDFVEMDCFDSSGGQVTPSTSLQEYMEIDRGRIHTITGPVFVKGAKPGDVLEVRILGVEHQGWGWTSIIPGLGSLPDRFTSPFLFQWNLEGDYSTSMPGVRLPLSPFLGIMGVCPAESGEHRTRPPGPFGGNLDVKQLIPGSTLYLPVFNEGALFSAGDGHGSQGDGEVCINGIEAPMKARFQLVLRKDMRLDQPFAEVVPPKIAVGMKGSYAFVASSEQVPVAMRDVIGRAIDFISAQFNLSPEQAYVLCSVALDLKISQCVNVPMTTVSAFISKDIFNAV